jgi:hypothetical protein
MLRSIPARWTDVLGIDPFVMIAAGRSAFRIVDLLELCRLVEGISRQFPVADIGRDVKNV